MRITVTPSAVACFKEEWGFVEGDFVRIFTRYSGGGEDAFSFGIIKDTPHYPAASAVEGKITFFMEQNDSWYLDSKDLTLDCRDQMIIFDRA